MTTTFASTVISPDIQRLLFTIGVFLFFYSVITGWWWSRQTSHEADQKRERDQALRELQMANATAHARELDAQKTQRHRDRTWRIAKGDEPTF